MDSQPNADMDQDQDARPPDFLCDCSKGVDIGAATCSDYIENVLPSVEAILVEILDLHQCRVYYYITK